MWRAVAQDDEALDILVPSRRDKKAAKKFFRKFLKHLQYVPRVSAEFSSYVPGNRVLQPTAGLFFFLLFLSRWVVAISFITSTLHLCEHGGISHTRKDDPIDRPNSDGVNQQSSYAV